MIISVIVAMYNARATLGECLDSLAACPAGADEVEFILVDDASSDGTKEICGDYARADSRYRLVGKERNSGVSESRNMGIEMASGEYLFFLDADDYLYADAWPGLLARAREGRYDLVAFAYDTLFPDGGRKAETFPIEAKESDSRDDLHFAMLTTPMLNPCWGNLLRRRTALQADIRFAKGLKTCEDALFMIDFAEVADRCLLCNERVMAYRIIPGSAMRRRDVLGKLSDFRLLYGRRNQLMDRLRNDALKEAAYRQYFSVITALMLEEAAFRRARELRSVYRGMILVPLVREIIRGVSPGSLATPYKKMEYRLLKKEAIGLLALYFRIKSRFIRPTRTGFGVTSQRRSHRR